MSERLINTKYNVGDKVYRASTWCKPSKEPATVTDITITVTKSGELIHYMVNDNCVPIIAESELYSTYKEARAVYRDKYLAYLEDEYGDSIQEYLELKKEKEDAESK